MQSIARDSDESSDDEYFDAHGTGLFPGAGREDLRGSGGGGDGIIRSWGFRLTLGINWAWKVGTVLWSTLPQVDLYSDGIFVPHVSLFPQETLQKHGLL